MALPVEEVLPELCAAVRERGCAVLEAPPGAGKTTRVPGALLDAGLAGAGVVLVVQPRRVAARAAARRVAAERGGRLGEEVGFQVRFERKASARTRLLYVTDGIALRFLQEDPLLERFGAIVFDEVHERRLASELSLALATRVRAEAREDLALVCMSATLDAQSYARFLGDAPIVRSEGRLYPVELLHRPKLDRAPLEERVAQAVELAVERGEDEGDVLVFLPGVGEIRRASRCLERSSLARTHELVPLYGDLEAKQQDAALRRGPRPRVVLATNLAETSVTVEGVRSVVDSGLVRRMLLDPAVGLDRLELGQVSLASADQRSGRAGREAPGLCIRLWDVREERGMPRHEQPEVQRVDLAGALLELLAWGEREPQAFPWFEAPSEDSMRHGIELLERLGAIHGQGLTARGRAMARLPLHPRLACLLIEGAARGAGRQASLLAALLSERSAFERDSGPAPRGLDSDLLERAAACAGFEANGNLSSPVGRLHPGAVRGVLRTRDQLARSAPADSADAPADLGEALGRALLAAFPDRLCRRRRAGEPRARMVGGHGVCLSRRSGVSEAEYFLALEVAAARPEAQVHSASAVERAWLPADECEEAVELSFDEERARVVARRELRLHGLALESVEVDPFAKSSAEEVARVLVEAARRDPEHSLGLERPELVSFLTRLRSLAHWRPELELPTLATEELATLLPDLAHGLRSLAELERAPLLDHLRARLRRDQLAALEREAPERIEVPSGSKLALVYEPGRAPVLAVRIQELFGWRETPRVAGGRVPVLLHLLAPNYRAQQVTDDLASFWSGAYHEVKKELRRRYPRHAWPEDPLTAEAQRRPQRRRDR